MYDHWQFPLVFGLQEWQLAPDLPGRPVRTDCFPASGVTSAGLDFGAGGPPGLGMVLQTTGGESILWI